jgi:hypothetical protein
VSRRLSLLTGGCLAFWLLTALPARHLGGGDLAVVYAGTAVLLCLAPAVATLLWAGHAARHDPQQEVLVVLGSTGVRLFGVVLAAWLLHSLVPLYQEQGGFWLWLLAAYLFTLALEVTLLVAGRPRADGPA